MSNFIGEYLEKLRGSDEKTKHKSALTISIVLTIISLCILFLIFKNKILTLNRPTTEEPKVSQNESDLESPTSLFSNFFQESGEQISRLRSSVSDFFKNRDQLKDLNK